MYETLMLTGCFILDIIIISVLMAAAFILGVIGGHYFK